ncbi:MAG: hypothetical protein CMQ41_09070 [Gammaproteobacteria bacterium]|nr:hypothetical protein [Gammaproteobacteria bacterium]|tara:strand:- start:1736 stop:2209 length:474 start_codon:yes stop_codon:yes gene_type:complete
MIKILTLVSAALFLALPLAAVSQLDRVGIANFTQQSQPQPLRLEQAFPFVVSALSPGKFRVTWNLAPGHYLYRHAFEFSLALGAAGEDVPVKYQLPDGIQKIDQFFGNIEAYYNQITVDLELTTVPGRDAELIIKYQGCADWGFCYPPQLSSYKLLP